MCVLLTQIGANVEVRQSDGQYLPGLIQKLTDASTYTVGKEGKVNEEYRCLYCTDSIIVDCKVWASC